jgi:predicted alpha/beta superfamily hydrolase
MSAEILPKQEVDTDNTLKINLKTFIPEHTQVYLTGNFNKWNPADSAFKMTRVSEDAFEFTFDDTSDLPELIEYKYTLGGWENSELNEYGLEAQNRTLFKDALFSNDIAHGWKQNGLAYRQEFTPIIETISHTFEIPQLIKTRRITALLPHNYHQTDKRYPVLYLQDGQNLFDDFAPFGSWGLDKRLAFMAEKGMPEFIVIAIDHAEHERIKEFTPSTRTKLGVGEGEKYAQFLAETLKPYIDSHFRTLSGKEFTGIGGSSMGGLISIYAAMQHPHLYSRLMIFSPSFWVTPDLPRRFIHHTPDFNGKIFLYGGGMEGSNMVFYLHNFRQIIREDPHHRNIDVCLEVKNKGTHCESEWGNVFPKAANWLFGHS